MRKLLPLVAVMLLLAAVAVGAWASSDEEVPSSALTQVDGPSPTPTADATPTPASAEAVYWGAWIGSHITGMEAPWDMEAVSRFERGAGKPLSIVNFSSPFANCYSTPCRYYAFPAAEFTAIRNHGAIPFFSWGSNSQPSTAEFLLDDVIAGRHDAYLTQWATAAKQWGHPYFLRFNWEMNTPWFPWTEGYPGNQPGQYVAAWHHVHDLFVSVGATNATWVWCPNVDPEKKYQPLSEIYPGDEYVDWTGLDGYSWGAPFESFASIFKSTYEEIVTQIAPSKPMFVCEAASPEFGASKPQWITEMFTSLPVTFPKVRGLLYFDKYDSGMDWPIETSVPAQQAFAAGIGSSRYTTNTFGTLETSPIPPP